MVLYSKWLKKCKSGEMVKFLGKDLFGMAKSWKK
jgi:hypothetical protein